MRLVESEVRLGVFVSVDANLGGVDAVVGLGIEEFYLALALVDRGQKGESVLDVLIENRIVQNDLGGAAGKRIRLDDVVVGVSVVVLGVVEVVLGQKVPGQD